MRLVFAIVLIIAGFPIAAQEGPLQAALQANAEDVERASRRTVDAVVEAVLATGSPEAPALLEAWADKELHLRDDGAFVYAERDGDGYDLRDIDTGGDLGTVGRRAVKQLKPNAGVRRVLASALVAFQLSDPEPRRRIAALNSIARRPSADALEPLRISLEGEDDPAILARKERLERILTARFAENPAERVAAIEALAARLSLEARAALNRILATEVAVFDGPAEGNVRRILSAPDAPDPEAARAALRAADLLPAPVGVAVRDAALVAAITDGTVAGRPLAALDDEAVRWAAYDDLAADGTVPPRTVQADIDAAVARHTVAEVYAEDEPAVTEAAEAALAAVERRVARSAALDLGLDGLSLASIYFLAAIGLAVTFGVMGVINMAHGEFIMIGAYTGYAVQQVVPDYTLSLAVALPLAFVVAALAGILLERLVIRHLLHRPLETLLATFGISIALQQIAKNVFGTQARPLTSPDWLAGSWVIDEVAQISWIRVAIFVLAALFLGLIVWVLRRTRLGLEVRAVTQNPGMAASMGIDPDRINMATFALGSGIAGVAGVAIGLYAQVTSEMGTGYIVQSFMTVVVGGVGSVLGTLAGAGMIGGLQKGIEWLNPSTTLAAQTYMILFVIAFIQIRPRGIVPQRGRAAG